MANVVIRIRNISAKDAETIVKLVTEDLDMLLDGVFDYSLTIVE